MADHYLTLHGAVTAEIDVKRSRFLCDLVPVADEASAREVIERTRKTHWDARHHCSAFVLGAASDVRRSNDDGEPSGTAGMPMLEVLLGAGLTDVVAVVTRWFGGTLLGTGGLVKAYGDAVRAALARARIDRYERLTIVTTAVPVADAGRIENALRAAGVVVRGVEYAVEARFDVAVAPARLADAEVLLAELTSGRSQFVHTGQTWAIAR